MLTEERHRLILQLLRQKGTVSVTELVETLDISESTVRRDLIFLDQRGKLKKVHGGAVHIGNLTAQEETHVNKRQSFQKEQKMKIAQYAAELIKDEDTVYIDAGTTTAYMIDFIKAKRIVVVTNGIVHAKKLLEKNITTYVLGGQLKSITEAVVGINAVQDLRKYNFSKGFFGTNGISITEGYTTPDLNEAMVKEEAIKRSQEAYILGDSSKYDQVSFVTFCDLENATLIIDELEEKAILDGAKVIQL